MNVSPLPAVPSRVVALLTTILFSSLIPPSTALGQAAKPAGEEIVTLEKFVAAAKADDLYDVLPARESSSLFGV
jgi:hypothetical protein